MATAGQPQYPQAGYTMQPMHQPPSYPAYGQGTPPPQQQPMQQQPYGGYPPQQPNPAAYGAPQQYDPHPQFANVQQHQPWGSSVQPAQPPPPSQPLTAEEKKKEKEKNASSTAGGLFIFALAEIGVCAAVVHFVSQGRGYFRPSAIGFFATVLALAVIATFIPCFAAPSVKKRSAIPIHTGYGSLLVIWLIIVALLVTAPRGSQFSTRSTLERRKGGKGGGGGGGGSFSGGSSGSGGGDLDDTTRTLVFVCLGIAILALLFVVCGWISQTLKWRKRVKKYQAEGWPVREVSSSGAGAAETKPFISA